MEKIKEVINSVSNFFEKGDSYPEMFLALKEFLGLDVIHLNILAETASYLLLQDFFGEKCVLFTYNRLSNAPEKYQMFCFDASGRLRQFFSQNNKKIFSKNDFIGWLGVEMLSAAQDFVKGVIKNSQLLDSNAEFALEIIDNVSDSY